MDRRDEPRRVGNMGGENGYHRREERRIGLRVREFNGRENEDVEMFIDLIEETFRMTEDQYLRGRN